MPNFISRSITSKFYDSVAHNRIGFESVATRSAGVGYSLNRFIADMTDDGQWAGLDAAYIFDPESQIYTDLTGNGHALTETELLTYIAGRGLEGDGTTGKLLGIGTPAALTKFLQDDCAVTVHVTEAGNQIAQLGRSGGSGQTILVAGPSTLSARLNSASSANFSVKNSVGATTIFRDPALSGFIGCAKNGTDLGSVSNASTTKQASPLAIFNSNTTFSSDTIFALLIGAGITSAQAISRNGWLNQLAISKGWSPIPAPSVLSALTQMTAITIPDTTGATAGKGGTNTGLAIDSEDGTLWLGIDGRGASADTTFDAGILHMNADGTSPTFTSLASLGVGNDKCSIQGVCEDTATSNIYFMVVDTATPASSFVGWINKAGALQGTWTTTGNGLTYNAATDLIGLVGSTLTWRSKTTGILSSPAGGTNQLTLDMQPDQGWVDPTGNWLLISGGPNDAGGILHVWSLANQWGCPVHTKTVTLTDARAIEGVAIVGSTLYVNSDQYYHPATGGYPVLNQLQTYDATGLLA